MTTGRDQEGDRHSGAIRVSGEGFSAGSFSGVAAISALVFLMLFWGGCGREEKTGGGAETKEVIATGSESTVVVAFGDSLTEGFGVDVADSYPSLLEKKLQAAGMDVRVVNSGVSGETSSGAFARVDWVLRLAPDIVIFETGANDGLRGIDTELTRRNIERAAEKFAAAGVTVVLAGMEMVANLGHDHGERFRRIYPAVAEKHGLILIPFFLESVAAVPHLNIADGIHPNAEGYAKVVDNVWPHLLTAFRRRAAAP